MREGNATATMVMALEGATATATVMVAMAGTAAAATEGMTATQWRHRQW